jgi:hypothetical protein
MLAIILCWLVIENLRPQLTILHEQTALLINLHGLPTTGQGVRLFMGVLHLPHRFLDRLFSFRMHLNSFVTDILHREDTITPILRVVALSRLIQLLA